MIRAIQIGFILCLLAAPIASSRTASRVPTDMDQLNGFAARYNDYVDGLRRGKVDLRAWARVERSWRDMAGE